jgi:lysophospholipase L1-like esterase
MKTVTGRAALGVAIFALLAIGIARGAEPELQIDVPANFHASSDKAQVKPLDGKSGPAMQLSFAKDSKNAFIIGKGRGQPSWDKAAGFSFWVKGDGSDHLGAIELIWNDDYGLRYAYAFPLTSTEWKKIVVPWSDLLPEVSNPAAKPIDAAHGNAPGKLGAFWFGKWWYWRDAAAYSYTIEDLRLEPTIEVQPMAERSDRAPLARVAAKLKAHEPVTIVTMGDSLTDYVHWSNHETNWPTFLKQDLEKKYGSKVTIVNPAIGGTELRQNIILLAEWSSKHPAPDLVTINFGGNDWNAGMRGPGFEWSMRQAVELIRRATGGKADVLVMTTCPNPANWDTMAELAKAGRKASTETHAGLADIYAAFHAAGKGDKDHLFAWDHVHLSKAGQQLFATEVTAAIERDAK